ncbi:unnamed protein product [Protopolystoma xenopodis]|uniref:L1 transposable element RRM domain-containing protein n=1 Tax=Protopolystoma xenopodis TaxID=117903 RepID=A0A3S5ABT3_9PLAT|nr:unnamed protein product [Protopolystoma xenopodis]
MKKHAKNQQQTPKPRPSKIARELPDPDEFFDPVDRDTRGSKMAAAKKRESAKNTDIVSESSFGKAARGRNRQTDMPILTECDTEHSDSESEEEEDIRSYLKCLPSKAEIKSMLQNLSVVLTDEMRDIRKDIVNIAVRTDTIEKAQEKLLKHNTYLHKTVKKQAQQIEELERQMEDFENRSRRVNLRVRGIPEIITQGELKQALWQIFNSILNRDTATEIKMDRFHRVAKTKNAPHGAPRDVLCALHNFTEKEEIISKAREINNITYEDSKILIFQDISWKTLSKRRNLKPLTDAIKEKGLQFKWGFPFHISVRKEGQWMVLKSPKDTEEFCKKLGIEKPPLPGWDVIPTPDFSLEKLPEFWITPLKQTKKMASTPNPRGEKDLTFAINNDT